ncbi:MAG: DUF1598 domain-containing protein [Planctomycetaceae bacterium]
MCCSSRWLRAVIRILMLLTASLVVATAQAQFNAGNQGGNQGGGGAGAANQAGGILIDAEGVVRSLESQSVSAKLRKEASDAFLAKHLNSDVTTYSDRRYVSLVRLEHACAKALTDAESLGEEVRYLAGLQQIEYLFVDPEGSDLVIAGPAEGFSPDASGRMLGLSSGRPPLRIDDLIVALQASINGSSTIGCSIDPEPERLARMQQFLQQNSSPTSSGGASRRYQEMGRLLGLQNVSVFGVPPDTHFALALVEADFRMKRIALGVDPSGVRGLRSHLSLLKPNGNSIQRWWFTPYYEELSTTSDRTAFHLAGQRVQLLAQDEISNASGERSNAATTRASTQLFARMFTEKFPELAARSPVFAELQNLFDLTVIATLLQRERIPQKIGWDMAGFVDADTDLVSRYLVPRQVESASTFRQAGQGLVLGLIGGVTIEPRQLLREIQSDEAQETRLNGLRRVGIDGKPEGTDNWWWD